MGQVQDLGNLSGPVVLFGGPYSNKEALDVKRNWHRIPHNVVADLKREALVTFSLMAGIHTLLSPFRTLRNSGWGTVRMP